MARRLERARASENRNVRLYARVAISGTPEQAIARIREYVQAGVTHFVCHFGRADVTAGTEMFAREIIPAFR
jgi:alkanesulfonate monooxygenase SsuD/methylene tetrahydromethanopterin reductase-like flavin-dependent oxidoreductase (luciferase family)